MQISLGNHYLYAPRIDVGAVSEKFKNAAAQDKQAVIRDAMKWWEPIVDCFYGHKQEKALALVFEIAQAEKANEDPTLSHAEKAENRCRAEEAFLGLKKYALPQYKFDVVPNFNGKLRFKVTDADIGNASEKSITSDFNCFDTENAEQLWKEMRSSFMVENGPAAIGLLNQLCNATSSCEKIDCFTQLTKLAEADAQNKFKLIMQAGPGIATAAYISLSFGDTVKFENLICPHDQMDGIWSAVLAFAGSRELKKAELASPETEQLFSLVVGLRNDMFNADDKTRSAAAKILAEMFRPNKTVQDDMRSCVKLSKLDPRFRNLFKVSFAKTDDGKLILCLNLAGKPYRRASFENSVGMDLSGLDLRGTDLRDVQLRGAKVDGAKFDATVLTPEYFDADQLNTLRAEAATVIQKNIRGWLATGTKESQESHIRALKGPGPDRVVIAHELQSKGYRYVAASTVKIDGKSGTYKTLTGRTKDERFVELTVKNPTEFAESFTFNQSMLKIIDDENLDKIVPPRRANLTKIYSKNVGPADLYAQLLVGQYTYSVSHFEKLASQLETLHRKGLVHRDIKPGNLVLADHEMSLIDCDSMAKRDELASMNFSGTREYIHPEFFASIDKGMGNYPIIARAMDQYAFFVSMIEAKTGVPPDRTYPPHFLYGFVQGLKCSHALKSNLYAFLQSPTKVALAVDLDKYLKP